jgi:hypothetical protein
MTSFIYPIRLDSEVKYIPRAMITPHDEQCVANHGKSLDVMEQSYGGLTPAEAMAILEDREFARMPLSVARRRLQEMSVVFMHGRTSPSDAAHVNSRLETIVQRLEHMRDGHTVPSRTIFNMVLEDVAMIRRILK